MKRDQGSGPRQTRIVATIGNSHDQPYPTFLGELVQAGVDVLRLNMSHADAGYAKEQAILDWANQALPDRESPAVAVMADLQGPKTRIGRMPGDGLPLEIHQAVQLVSENRQNSAAPSDVAIAEIPVPELLFTAITSGLAAVLQSRPGVKPYILFGDGDIAMEVLESVSDSVRGIVVAGGVLGSRKGITVREIDLDLDPFPMKDQEDLRFALRNRVDAVAISFVRTTEDVLRVRAFIDAAPERDRSRPPPLVIAKIETLSAIEHIDDILNNCEGIMVARGDLGLQLGVEEVPMVQKQLINAARRHGKPVIVATQMLESMIANPTPTRAEATDVFNAILDGGDAVMLSGETSVGTRPVQVVRVMDRLARKAEAWCRDQQALGQAPRLPRPVDPQDGQPHLRRINDAFALTAVQFAEHLPARAIICSTRTGRTPERLSRYRPTVPVLAFVYSEAVARALLFYYGVHPVLLQLHESERQKSEMIDLARSILRRQYGMTAAEPLVVTAGMDWPKGGTNVLQVLIEDQELAAQLPLVSRELTPQSVSGTWRVGHFGQG